jgi:hypothetical protein
VSIISAILRRNTNSTVYKKLNKNEEGMGQWSNGF